MSDPKRTSSRDISELKQRLGLKKGGAPATGQNRANGGQTAGIAIMGAIWSSLVFSRSGAILAEGATSAPATAQVAGLHDTFLVMVALVAVGLALWDVNRKQVYSTLHSIARRVCVNANHVLYCRLTSSAIVELEAGMTPQARAALESAQKVLHHALVAYADGSATLDYVTDGRTAHSCLVADGQILLAVCDPPISVSAVGREH